MNTALLPRQPWLALRLLLLLAGLLAALSLQLAWQPNQAQAHEGEPSAQTLSLELHSIASSEPGVKLSLREKRLAHTTQFASDRVVLLLEPFGVPAAEGFDAHIPGISSMMDYLALQGYDVWALDFRGFGASDRPAAYNQPMMANPPQLRAAEAAKDIEAAMNYIGGKRGVEKSHLVGWSWGTVAAAQYAGDHPDRVGKLVIYGGMHAFQLPEMTQTLEDPNNPGHIKQLPAYQVVTPQATTLQHWNMQQSMGAVPHSAAAEAELSRIFLASDSTSGSRNPASIRRAMGPMVDLYEIWSGRPVFDAAKITAPTLIIRGAQDAFSNDPGYLDALTHAAAKKYVEIPAATHWAIYEETAAAQLLTEIGSFLAPPAPPASQGLLTQVNDLIKQLLGFDLGLGGGRPLIKLNLKLNLAGLGQL